MYEIVTSQNDSGWKIIWGLVSFFLGTLGVIIYYFFARKNLQGNEVGFLKTALLVGVMGFVGGIILTIITIFLGMGGMFFGTAMVN